MSHKKKRAAKLLIARRAFLSPTFIQATLHACIPAYDFIFLKFYRITVYFYDIPFLHRTFLHMMNARPCDFCARFIRGRSDLFALCSRNRAFFSVKAYSPYRKHPPICGKTTVGGCFLFSVQKIFSISGQY